MALSLSTLNIQAILRQLSQVRPVFHSEADFQHALAWRIQQLHPLAALRLEFRAPTPGKPIHLDVMATDESARIAIEVKYKTRKLVAVVGNEEFSLLTHGANPLGRYDFVKDIWRIEEVIEGGAADSGYAILLTNDGQYWGHVVGSAAGDTSFRLFPNAILQGKLAWGESYSPSTIRGREAPIQLRGRYTIDWCDYSQIKAGRAGRFRCLVVPVQVLRPE